MSKECCSHDDEKEVALTEAALSSDRTAEHPGPKETDHDHDHDEESLLSLYGSTTISLLLLVSGIALDYFDVAFFQGIIRFLWFAAAYVFTGGKVLLRAYKTILKGEVFNEFFLMGIATLGAFYIGEYAEGVAVMLFYVIGEHFQEAAVLRSRKNIKALIDNRPQCVTQIKNGSQQVVHPSKVSVGDTIQVKPGERVALDGLMLSENSSFNTAALTGESKPDTKRKGEQILAGMVNLDKVVELSVTANYEDSALARILKMVERATGRKAKTQQFITKFAKVYTPIVVYLAIALVILPYFFVDTYVFNEWLYRALIFLVISCPCALVISIPLGYFGGIGAASRNGILFKGSTFLDEMTRVDTVVMDKTGTLTEGVFKVQQVHAIGIEPETLITILSALESRSTHPIAKAVVAYAKDSYQNMKVEHVEEIPGHGLKGSVNGLEVLAGNVKLLSKFSIAYDKALEQIPFSIVAVAVNGKYAGYITVADQVKPDAGQTIQDLHRMGISKIVMLSGDKPQVVEAIASQLKIDEYHGGLLPEDKVRKVEELKSNGRKVAFAGDGINDAPVITLADVGIAMGALGSDAAIETADVVIQTDQPSKIATSIKIGKATQRVVWQNIGLSFGVKALVLVLGAWGMASMWEAVFADVGVAFLAILNAIRIQRMKF